LKLFELGFSTGKSSGLGLYLVKKMMDVYGWTITEEGEPGKGVKFVITIASTVLENQLIWENQHAN
jgi:signal transduction histidine kinase